MARQGGALLASLAAAASLAIFMVLMAANQRSPKAVETLMLPQLKLRTYNWRTDNEAVPCIENPDCGYGNININPKAYDASESPLAIINEDFHKDQVNPFPGPRNWGPDSPISYLPEDGSVDGVPKREEWPDYPPKGPGKRQASNSDRNAAAAMLRFVNGATLLQARPEIVPMEDVEIVSWPSPNWRRA